MFIQKLTAFFLFIVLLAPGLTLAQQTQTALSVTSNDAIAKIRDEGMNRSQVMATMRYLTDVIGARLTNSPAQRRASLWTKDQFDKWGLQNTKIDPWGEFGRGWELKHFSASIVAPDYMAIRAYPRAWSPSTPGNITGDVVYVDAANEAELEKYKGKLKGAIILTVRSREVKPGFEPSAERLSDEALTKLADAKPQPAQAQSQLTPEQIAAAEFANRKFRFYHEEGAAVLIDSGFGTDAGTIRVMGAVVPVPAKPTPGVPLPTARSKNAPTIIPQIVAEVEQYNRLYRLVKQGVPLKMTADLEAKFYDDDLQGYNTLAEIPGTDLKDEVVMIGAHMDSWHGGTGATDNGAGTTVAMEAMRILQASGLKPRRTIRVALWSGEEQGLLGSRGYVAKNFVTIGDGSPSAAASFQSGQKVAITKKPAYDKFTAYYNLDNGTGRIRGVYMQGNESVRPIFREWLAPFKEMGASTLTINGTGGTDHLPFDAVGLPGFQFIQDPIEYFTRSWHTTQDVSDRILEDDLKQSAIIMAAFAYNSAMSDEKLPRKTNPNLTFASLFEPLDWLAQKEERLFRASNFHFSICGHDLSENEIPVNIPGVFAFGTKSYSHGE
jgi:hypothetical protein